MVATKAAHPARVGDMMQYELPKPDETVVKRQFAHDRLQDDLFGIYHDGEWLADVSYQTARAYWLGRVTLADILGGDHD